jgi:hypothetical protein
MTVLSARARTSSEAGVAFINSPEPQEGVDRLRAVGAAPAIEPPIAVGETSRSASSPPRLEAPNLPEPQDSSRLGGMCARRPSHSPPCCDFMLRAEPF